MTHKDLIVWKESIDFVKLVYLNTQNFPKEEKYGIVSQIRRAAISIPSNLAEGCGRRSPNELIQFLYYALGSCSEIETQLIISKELDFLTLKDFDILIQKNTSIIRMLTALLNSIKTK